MTGLTKILVRNYRALADIDLDVGPINVLFGPNGAGKSTLLDTLYFFRDFLLACSGRGGDLRRRGIPFACAIAPPGGTLLLARLAAGAA